MCAVLRVKECFYLLWNLFSAFKPVFSDDEIMLMLSAEIVENREIGVTDGFTFHIYERKPRRKVGYVSLRLGESPQLYYLGHIGYRIEEPYRGHGYAARACQMIIPLMQELQLSSICITANPDNIPSRKTCERIGCELESIVKIPEKYRFVCSGDTDKCRYILRIPPKA